MRDHKLKERLESASETVSDGGEWADLLRDMLMAGAIMQERGELKRFLLERCDD